MTTPSQIRPASRAPASLGELLARSGVAEQLEVRSTFGFLALHGGGLEAGTDVVAAAAAERAGASYYAVLHPPGYEWHLPSTGYVAVDSPALSRFLSHVDVVVSLHRYGRPGRERSLLVGGRDRTLAEEVAAALRRRLGDYEVVTALEQIPPELRGISDRNPVNMGRSGAGVQVELPPRVRGLSPNSPPPGPDGLSPPTAALVDGLVAAAEWWHAAAPRDPAVISTRD